MLETMLHHVIYGYWESLLKQRHPEWKLDIKWLARGHSLLCFRSVLTNFPDPSKTFRPLVGLPTLQLCSELESTINRIHLMINCICPWESHSIARCWHLTKTYNLSVYLCMPLLRRQAPLGQRCCHTILRTFFFLSSAYYWVNTQ